MVTPESLTPETIQRIMHEVEIPLRRKTFAPDIINEICRYGAIIGNTIEHHAQISRGMGRARQLIEKDEMAKQSFASGTVILADEMVQSKGRFKRSWHAPRGGLWMTVVLVNTLLPESSLLIPIAAGISCCEVLRDYGIEAHIKWVNDILIKNKKIAGVLVETFTGRRSGEEYVLIGLGINVNNDAFPPELSGQAVALKSCLGKEINLAGIGGRLLAKLRWNIGLLFFEEARHLEDHGGVAIRHAPPLGNGEHLLLKSFKALTDILNRKVVFGFDVQEKPQFEAKVVGLANSGGIILELADGTRIVKHSGEISYLD
ncbi:MAG: biotin--[acetyl-CoA-carboxylase] ligase [Desulfobulbales bacterium]